MMANQQCTDFMRPIPAAFDQAPELTVTISEEEVEFLNVLRNYVRSAYAAGLRSGLDMAKKSIDEAKENTSVYFGTE